VRHTVSIPGLTTGSRRRSIAENSNYAARSPVCAVTNGMKGSESTAGVLGRTESGPAEVTLGGPMKRKPDLSQLTRTRSSMHVRPWPAVSGAGPGKVLDETGGLSPPPVASLLNDISEETTRRKRAEAQLLTTQNDLQGLRDFYAGFESPLQDKSQETKDAEADEKVVYDLHVEAMDALKAEHIAHAHGDRIRLRGGFG